MKTNLKAIELKIIAGVGPGGGMCKDGVCPTVYKSNDGRFFVQGASAPQNVSEAANVPKGEALVEVPQALLENLISKRDSL